MKIADASGVPQPVSGAFVVPGGPGVTTSGNTTTLYANAATTPTTVSSSPYTPSLPVSGQLLSNRAVQSIETALSALTIQLPSTADCYVTECRLYVRNTGAGTLTVTISGGKGGPYTVPTGQILELFLRPTGQAALGYWTTAGSAFS
jgi:hypothetical protein